MLPEAAASYFCEHAALQRLWDLCELRCRGNLRSFGGKTVLVEGGGYEKLWLETQPMGGDMYALRSPEAALNNTLLFMQHQRADGRLPGSIRKTENGMAPEYNKLQGFCFPHHALNLYYTLSLGEEWLDALSDCLSRFDAWLWRTRDCKGEGLLSSFCVYDTGEDNAVRYGDAPRWWSDDAPPQGYASVPMTSMDLTSWSYAARDTLSKIAVLRGDEDGAGSWRRRAAEAASALRLGLWDEARGTLYDRDSTGRRVEVLTHNPLRCMYWGSLSPHMASLFVLEHLCNPAEFWTRAPLPSVAVNDPAFRNAPENNWSGQAQGLTWQRAIIALERYGYEPLVTALGRRVLRLLMEGGCRFCQQFDPLTGAPSLVGAVSKQPLPPGSEEAVQEDYCPTMLAALTYVSHLYGVDVQGGQIWFSMAGGEAGEYTVQWNGHRYRVASNGRMAEASADGRILYRGPCGVRLVTDAQGRQLRARIPLDNLQEGMA